MPVLEFEKIFAKYKKRVYALALGISRNERDAEDITQNTFIKVLRNIKGFRKQSSLSTWIYRIAYNEALMHFRKKRSFLNLKKSLHGYRRCARADMLINWPKLPDEQLLDGELKERLDNAMSRMPIQYRLPLLLRNTQDLPIKEASIIMGLKLNSFKTRLHRAQLMLKNEVTDYFQDRVRKQAEQESKCGMWLGFAYDYILGHLDAKNESAFKGHIADCLGCKSFLDTYMQAIRLTKALECHDLPDQLKAKIESFISKKG